jgi:hypothetical protein
MVPAEVDFSTARATDLAAHLVGQKVELSTAQHKLAEAERKIEALSVIADAYKAEQAEKQDADRKKYLALQKTLLSSLKKQFADGFITPETEEVLEAAAKHMPDQAIHTMNTLLQVASCASQGWEQDKATSTARLQELERQSKEWELKTLSHQYNKLNAPPSFGADPGRLADPASRFEAAKARSVVDSIRVPQMRTAPPPEAAIAAPLEAPAQRPALTFDDQIRMYQTHAPRMGMPSGMRPLAAGVSEAGAGRTGGGAMMTFAGAPVAGCLQEAAPGFCQDMAKRYQGASLATIQKELTRARGGPRV